MAATRTFLDANVLILAFRGTGQVAMKARDVVDDPAREFVGSDILRLELVPKAHYHGKQAEEQFYQDYLAAVAQYVATSPDLVSDAEAEAKANGLAAIDALHMTAAKRAAADEFVTAEQRTKPLFRVQGLNVTSIRP